MLGYVCVCEDLATGITGFHDFALCSQKWHCDISNSVGIHRALNNTVSLLPGNDVMVFHDAGVYPSPAATCIFASAASLTGSRNMEHGGGQPAIPRPFWSILPRHNSSLRSWWAYLIDPHGSLTVSESLNGTWVCLRWKTSYSLLAPICADSSVVHSGICNASTMEWAAHQVMFWMVIGSICVHVRMRKTAELEENVSWDWLTMG